MIRINKREPQQRLPVVQQSAVRAVACPVRIDRGPCGGAVYFRLDEFMINTTNVANAISCSRSTSYISYRCHRGKDRFCLFWRNGLAVRG
jgi:hypothetical protein